jgi:hypothetical protein
MPIEGWFLVIFGTICFSIGFFFGRLGSRNNKEKAKDDHVHTRRDHSKENGLTGKAGKPEKGCC